MEELELDNYSTFEVIDWQKFTIFSDKNCKLFAILRNWVYEKQFNIDFLNKFDDFQLHINWELNTNLYDFIINYPYYE